MQYVVLVAMALFLGFAFEEFYGQEVRRSPGGVRAFPMLSFAGAALYLIEPQYAAAFIAGLLVLGSWLFLDVRERMLADDPGHGYLMVPVSTLAAYVLGAVAMTQPVWFTIALTVAAVLLIGSRVRLHDIAERVPFREVLTAGQFLLLVGVVLPLLYNAPPIPFTTITPFKVWLAVVAVSAISYISYLMQAYVFPADGPIVSSMLGGLYSSTATTVVLAREARGSGYGRELAAGTIVATSMMYLRLLAIAAIFNLSLGRALFVPMVVLFALAVAGAAVVWQFGPRAPLRVKSIGNPLALSTALIFAVLLILLSQLSTWATAHMGVAGLLELAAVVGLTDVDPFVLGLAQSQAVAISAMAAAVLIAAAANNLWKAALAAGFSRRRESAVPVAALVALAALGGVAAWIVLQ